MDGLKYFSFPFSYRPRRGPNIIMPEETTIFILYERIQKEKGSNALDIQGINSTDGGLFTKIDALFKLMDSG